MLLPGFPPVLYTYIAHYLLLCFSSRFCGRLVLRMNLFFIVCKYMVICRVKSMSWPVSVMFSFKNTFSKYFFLACKFSLFFYAKLILNIHLFSNFETLFGYLLINIHTHSGYHVGYWFKLIRMILLFCFKERERFKFEIFYGKNILIKMIVELSRSRFYLPSEVSLALDRERVISVWAADIGGGYPQKEIHLGKRRGWLERG